MYIKYFKNNFSDVKKISFFFLIIFAVIIFLIINRINNRIEKKYNNIDYKSLVFEKVIPLLNSKLFNFDLQSSQIDSINNMQYFNYIYENDSTRIKDIHRLIKYLNSFDLIIKYNQINKNQYIIKIFDNNKPFVIIKLKTSKKVEKLKVKGEIALIIDDFGYFDNDLSDSFFNLPKGITFSVIPGHRFSKTVARKINKLNHDLLIHLPMEPLNYRGDEKQYIIMTGMNSNKIENRINKAINELPQAIGINNHMGSKATSDLETMNKVAKVIVNKELLFIDSYTYKRSIAYKVMKKHDIPTARGDMFIDNENRPDYISEQIDKLVQLAIKNGKAIGIGHVRKNTLLMLQKKIPDIISNGIIFVPISEYIR